jgi:hypothetical protein
MGALSNGGKRRKGGNLSALRSDHDDGVRSDRRGGVPITSVAIRAVRKRLGSPRASVHRGQGPEWPTNGPEIRLQSTSAIVDPLRFSREESRYAG